LASRGTVDLPPASAIHNFRSTTERKHGAKDGAGA